MTELMITSSVLIRVVIMLRQWVWYIGIGIVGMTLLLSNLSFGRKLRKTRKVYRAVDFKLPVYEVN